MKKATLALLLFLILSTFAAAQENDIWTPPEKDSLLVILDHIYNLEFTAFDTKMTAYKNKYPNRPEAIFGDAVALWTKVTADLYNPRFDDLFMTHLDSIIDQLENYEDDDPLYLVAEFYINAAIGFKAIMHVTRERWFSAALEGRKAVGGIEDALDGKIPNPDALLGTGLYLYYADIIPARYPILKPLFIFYPDGDKERGLNDLRETTENGVFAKVVGAYMYAVILYTREGKMIEAFNLMSALSKRYPQNPIFLMWQASIASRIGRYSVSKQLLQTYAKRVKDKLPFYPAHKMRIVNFRIGVIEFKNRNFKKALELLNEAIKPLAEPMETNLERYKVYALLQKGYCLERLGSFQEARDAYLQVLDMPQYRASHEQAEIHLEKVEKRLGT